MRTYDFLKTFIFLFVISFNVVLSKFIVEHGSLKIEAPNELKGDYDVALANFGVPLYGADLRGTFTYPAAYATACSTGLYPLGFPDTYTLSRVSGYSSIVVLDRGACRFTEKVRNAESIGADAVLICDNVDETLITMDAGNDMETQSYVNNITIPGALLQKRDCDRIKQYLGQSTVIGVLDWSDALPHPDDRVEWEFWTDSNNGCGDKCNTIMTFIQDFAEYGRSLEEGGYTKFNPRFLTYHCLPEYIGSSECNAQCLTNGAYCTTDPDDDLEKGYTGRDVVLENLRQLCVYQVANSTGKPWLWWEYASHFSEQCKMDDVKFNSQCAEPIITGLGLDLGSVQACMGEPDDVHPLLDLQKVKQVGDDERGDVTINPTVIINDRHYRGKLEKNAVLNALCAGFDISQEPEVCINPDVSKNECDEGKEGWVACKNNPLGKTHCEEKYRGFECTCPKGSSSFIDAAGQETQCEDENECAGTALELESCNCDRCVCINLKPDFQCVTIAEPCEHDTTCWVQGDVSACMDTISTLKSLGERGEDTRPMAHFNCTCPKGWEGDGFRNGQGCHNVNECATKCQGHGMKCKDTEGSYECTCPNSGTYDEASDSCMNEIDGGGSSGGASALAVVGIVISIVIVMAGLGYALYKYRLRSYMDAEIRAIMAQYMPLDKEADEMNDVVDGDHEVNNHDPVDASQV